MSSVRDSLPIQGLSQWYRESGFPSRKPGLLQDDGQQVFMRNHWLDNRWVVPYNPIPLMRYNCHINVEACCNIKSIKYIYKYIYKGHDNASFSIELGTTDGPIEINEVKQYKKARCITAMEAF
jgi:hypothetical protein